MAAKSALLSAVACTAIALSVVGAPALGSSAVAAPKPSESELRAELAKLDKKIDRLLEAYNAKRVSLAKAQQDEKVAQERLTKAEAELEKAQKLIVQLAQLHYQGNPNVTGFMTPESAAGAAVLSEIASEQRAAIAGVEATRDARQQAAEEAAALATQIKQETSELSSQREEAEDLIDDIKDKLEDLVPYGTGRRSDGSFAPELPGGPDNITPRTRLMRSEVQKNFGLRYPVGCYRVDNSGEHPLGRACDFMMSSGGAMATGANEALGDQIAAWAIKNMDKLGIKYVIWKQRINHGSGWRPMSNRGGITANHYDHVHISML